MTMEVKKTLRELADLHPVTIAAMMIVFVYGVLTANTVNDLKGPIIMLFVLLCVMTARRSQ
jgi:hypothetical protein